MNEEIRVRLAPSPTGWLHLGNARTALFNWLFARSKAGKLILRIEDTDKTRSKDEFTHDIIDCLLWLGIEWDEGPERSEPLGPYKQSERLEIYQKYAQELIKAGVAYNCYCTEEELEKERKVQELKKQAPRYSGRCRRLKPEEVKKFEAEGRKPALRFQVKPKIIKIKDLIKGEVEFNSELFGDFVIVKSDNMPTFIFAGVVDDYLMKISHVIRGEDHLSNTPRQILLSDALNIPVPEFGHLPLILNPDRTKLSKRKNPTSVSKDFRDKGYLPETMINFMALLGWSSKTDKEIWTLEELITEFDFKNVGKSPSIFDQKKLDYLNGYYIRKMSLGELAKASEDLLKDHEFLKDKRKFLMVLPLVQERLKKISDIPEQIEFFYHSPKNYQNILIPKNPALPAGRSTAEKTKKALSEALKYLSEENDFCRDSLDQLLRAVAKKNDFSPGEVLWPVRVALTGKTASPGTFEVLESLGKEESLKRIKAAIDMIQ